MHLCTLTGYLLHTHAMMLGLTLSFCKLFRLILLNYHICFKFFLYINKIKMSHRKCFGIFKFKTPMFVIFIYILTSCMCRLLINEHTNYLRSNISSKKSSRPFLPGSNIKRHYPNRCVTIPNCYLLKH